MNGEKIDWFEAMREGVISTQRRLFNHQMHLHAGMPWKPVERSLESNRGAILSVFAMLNADHLSNVFMEDDDAYYVGTCSKESPKTHRNIVYDAEAEAWLAENHPQETCNGNAVDFAFAMGVELMDAPQYRHLQTLGLFDTRTWSWLKTPDKIREGGGAFCGGRDAGGVGRIDADARNPGRTFRGLQRVSKA